MVLQHLPNLQATEIVRWAARFARQTPEPSSQKSENEKQGQQLGAPAKPKGKPAGPGSILRSSDLGWSQPKPQNPAALAGRAFFCLPATKSPTTGRALSLEMFK